MKFKFTRIIAVVFLSLLLFSSLVVLIASGQSDSDRVENLQEKISEYEKIIQKLQGQEKTLKNEIEYLSAQVYYTELKIQETTAQITQKENEIVSLVGDIDSLAIRLEKLNLALDVEEKIIKARVREEYKREGDVSSSPLLILAGSGSFADLVGKLKYLRLLEQQDKQILSQMNLTKTSFEGQKNLLTNKKDKIGLLKVEIEKQKQSVINYKSNLEDQRKTKEWILEETKNQQDNYQNLLVQIRAELDSINSAFVDIIGKEGKDVKAGDIIAYEGNSGCSTGPHLHFGVYKNGVAVNPRNYLGDELEWPIDNVIVTQEYGENYSWYMKNFGIPGHNGMDLTGPAPFYGMPIRSVADGTAYVSYDKAACAMTGTVGKGIVVVHDNGLKTVYWHVK